MRRVVSALAATAHCLPRRAVSFHFESTLGWRAVTRRHPRTLTRLDAPRGVLPAQQAHAQLTALTSSQKLSSHGLSTWRSCCAMFMLGARPFSGHHTDDRSVGVPCTTGLQAFAWSTRTLWPPEHLHFTCTAQLPRRRRVHDHQAGRRTFQGARPHVCGYLQSCTPHATKNLHILTLACTRAYVPLSMPPTGEAALLTLIGTSRPAVTDSGASRGQQKNQHEKTPRKYHPKKGPPIK